MTTNEILLTIGFIIILIIPSLVLKHIKQPINACIKLTCVVLLLILVWFSADGSALGIKVIMTTIVVSSALKSMKDYLDFSRQTKTRGR